VLFSSPQRLLLRDLSLSSITHAIMPLLADALPLLPELASLTLHVDADSNEVLNKSAPLRSSSLRKLVLHAPTRDTIPVFNVPKLRVLEQTMPPSDPRWWDLLTELEELRVRMPSREADSLQSLVSRNWLSPALRVFHCGGLFHRTFLDIASHWRHLEDLEIAVFASTPRKLLSADDFLRCLLRSAPSLRRCVIGRVEFVGAAASKPEFTAEPKGNVLRQAVPFTPGPPKLEVLSLCAGLWGSLLNMSFPSLRDLTLDAEMLLDVTCMPRLQSLRTSAAVRLAQSLPKLLSACPKLQRLHLLSTFLDHGCAREYPRSWR
jgi:hypothetical protein